MEVSYEIRESIAKNGKARRADLDPTTLSIPASHRAGQLGHPVITLDARHAFLFSAGDESPLHPITSASAFRSSSGSLGCVSLSINGLRHSHAALPRGQECTAQGDLERLRHHSGGPRPSPSVARCLVAGRRCPIAPLTRESFEPGRGMEPLTYSYDVLGTECCANQPFRAAALSEPYSYLLRSRALVVR